MSNLVAIYKCYRGGEWFGASLESIALHVDGIVCAMATRPYKPGPARLENTSEVLEEFSKSHSNIPIHTFQLNPKDQSIHYKLALYLALQKFGPDTAALVIDTDEVWSDDGIVQVAEVIRKREHAYYVAALYDYIKYPLWRTPNCAGHFVIGLGSLTPPLRPHNRFAGWYKSDHLTFPRSIRLHHFTLVRNDETEIPEKLANCAHADGAYRPDWLTRVWPRLPKGRNLHPSPGYEKTWPCIIKIPITSLPEAVFRCERSRLMIERLTR